MQVRSKPEGFDKFLDEQNFTRCRSVTGNLSRRQTNKVRGEFRFSHLPFAYLFIYLYIRFSTENINRWFPVAFTRLAFVR